MLRENLEDTLLIWALQGRKLDKQDMYFYNKQLLYLSNIRGSIFFCVNFCTDGTPSSATLYYWVHGWRWRNLINLIFTWIWTGAGFLLTHQLFCFFLQRKKIVLCWNSSIKTEENFISVLEGKRALFLTRLRAEAITLIRNRYIHEAAFSFCKIYQVAAVGIQMLDPHFHLEFLLIHGVKSGTALLFNILQTRQHWLENPNPQFAVCMSPPFLIKKETFDYLTSHIIVC